MNATWMLWWHDRAWLFTLQLQGFRERSHGEWVHTSHLTKFHCKEDFSLIPPKGCTRLQLTSGPHIWQNNLLFQHANSQNFKFCILIDVQSENLDWQVPSWSSSETKSHENSPVDPPAKENRNPRGHESLEMTFSVTVELGFLNQNCNALWVMLSLK